MFFWNCARKLGKKLYLCTKIIQLSMKQQRLPRGVKWIQLPQNVDNRGQLTFLEGNVHIPFSVKRVFWISDVPEGMTRGGHAHWTCHEAVFPITGRFEIELDDGEVNTTVVLDDATRGIIVPAGVWCELRHFAPGTVCLVMASQEYDASGYALDRESWMKTLKLKK